jgi:GTP diphosphokinase / guanosine-3',5'-bis(diphosphate) 3'-diphosphatase
MEKVPSQQNREKWINVMYNTTHKALLAKDKEFAKLKKPEQDAKMNIVLLAYTMAKAFHRWQVRLDGTRYFEHIRSVTYILMSEFTHITCNQVIAALLHDIVEDTHISIETIENIFWHDIAHMVDAVTKKPDEYYLWPDERNHYNAIGKEERKAYIKLKRPSIKARRTEHYFWHMRELHAEILQVKFADRIHNLRDLAHCKISKIKDQITETQAYLMPIAKEKNPTAYELMKKELEKLHKQVYGNTDKFKVYLSEALG